MVLRGYNPGHPPTSGWGNNNDQHMGNSGFKTMTRQQFEQWLDIVDSNRDGYISRSELYAALATLGLHFKTWKTWIAMRRCDKNHNRLIDPGLERKKLIDYAKKHWHIIVTN